MWLPRPPVPVLATLSLDAHTRSSNLRSKWYTTLPLLLLLLLLLLLPLLLLLLLLLLLPLLLRTRHRSAAAFPLPCPCVPLYSPSSPEVTSSGLISAALWFLAVLCPRPDATGEAPSSGARRLGWRRSCATPSGTAWSCSTPATACSARGSSPRSRRSR